jgi:hypothetical protein
VPPSFRFVGASKRGVSPSFRIIFPAHSIDKNWEKLYYRIISIGQKRGEKPMMQIRKTYNEVQPELLYDEVRDFVLKQGAVAGEAKLGTYSMPDNSSSFISRGTLTFNIQGGKECLRVHIVGSARGETKLILDINEELFSKEKVAALQEDLAFIFDSYEVKHR